MGLRFRKSIKLAPGVKLNLGKKSAGLSIGNKYGGVSFNSKAGVRSRASVPGTGISYTSKIGGKKSSKKPEKSTVYEKPVNLVPVPQRTWYKVVMALLIISGGVSLFKEPVGGALCFIGGIVMLFFWRKSPEMPKINETIFKNDLRIFDDSIQIFMKTTNPETYFGRYEDAYAAALRMAQQTDAPLVHNEPPQAAVEMLDRQKTEATNAFLDRYAKEIRTKAFELTRGKKAKIDSFKLITSEYDEKMTEESRAYRDKLYQEMKNKLESVEK